MCSCLMPDILNERTLLVDRLAHCLEEIGLLIPLHTEIASESAFDT